MRSMDSILSDEPSVRDLPDGDESDSRANAADTEKQKTKGVTPEADKAKAPVSAAADDSDESDQDVDSSDDLESLKTTLKAVRGDKRKLRKSWQEAERKIAHLEGQMTALTHSQRQVPQQAQGQQAPKYPDFYSDPEAHITARERALSDQMESVKFEIRATMSEALIAEQHPEDWETAKAAFVRAASLPQNQWMWQMVTSDAMPARVVYREGKKLLDGANGGGDEVVKLRQEVAELKAKLGGHTSDQDDESQSFERAPAVKPIPKTIASARGNGAAVKTAWTGPRTAEQIYGR